MITYIAIEGIDGAGTTTQTRLLAEALEGVEIKEPSAGPVGVHIRELLHENKLPEVWAHLFAVDRLEQYKKFTKPTIEAGDYVVSDRCVVSSMAYQVDEHRNAGDILLLNGLMTLPDLIIMIDISPGEAMERIRKRASESESIKIVQQFENEAYLASLVGRYNNALDVIYQSSGIRYGVAGPHIVRVDGSMSIGDVHFEIMKQVQLAKHNPNIKPVF